MIIRSEALTSFSCFLQVSSAVVPHTQLDHFLFINHLIHLLSKTNSPINTYIKQNRESVER
jgi:hypothetical protein